jgi:hypothetical protein
MRILKAMGIRCSEFVQPYSSTGEASMPAMNTRDAGRGIK